jgi:hypothetical protein
MEKPCRFRLGGSPSSRSGKHCVTGSMEKTTHDALCPVLFLTHVVGWILSAVMLKEQQQRLFPSADGAETTAEKSLKYTKKYYILVLHAGDKRYAEKHQYHLRPAF